jgi:hypothetical protein
VLHLLPYHNNSWNPYAARRFYDTPPGAAALDFAQGTYPTRRWPAV